MSPLVACVGLAVLSAPAWSTELTARDVLAFAHVDDLVGTPAGVIAWIVRDHGVRNVWVAASPGFDPRAVTDFTADLGERLSDLVVSENGEALAFVQGGGEEYASVSPPNSLSNVTPTREYVWALRRGESRASRIAPGTHPVLSRDGRRLLFQSGSIWWQASLSDNGPPRLLFELRGTVTQIRFSPDDRAIAFSVDRGAHRLIGTYRFDQPRIRWVLPDVYRDSSPAWSPDGRSIAFVRQPGRTYHAASLQPQPMTFEIVIADLADGSARTAWRALASSGDFAQDRGTPLAWSPGGKLVFQSEHEGWLRAYAMDPDGKNVTRLVEGDCELSNSVVSADGAALYYAANCEDIERSNLWRAELATGRRSRVTRNTALEFLPVLAGSRAIAFLSSSYNEPVSVALSSLDSPPPRLLVPRGDSAAFPAARFVEPATVTFKAPDGLTVHGQLFVPQGKSMMRRRPAVIFVHGGPDRQMYPAFHDIGAYSTLYAGNQLLAIRGFIVLSVNFRSGTGYGQAFRLAPDQGLDGMSEYQDVVAAAKYLADRDDVDRARIGIWGGSHGGLLAALALARNSDLFAAGVDINGVHDFEQDAMQFSSLSEAEVRDPAHDVLRRSSPIAAIGSWQSPVLLIHADDDRNVPVEQSIDLARQLQLRGVRCETLLLPDESHDLIVHENWVRTIDASVNFLTRELRPDE